MVFDTAAGMPEDPRMNVFDAVGRRLLRRRRLLVKGAVFDGLGEVSAADLGGAFAGSGVEGCPAQRIPGMKRPVRCR